MKLDKLAAIPAIAIAAGIGLAACGSVKAPVAKPAVTVTHTVAAKPVPAQNRVRYGKACPAETVYVPAPAPHRLRLRLRPRP